MVSAASLKPLCSFVSNLLSINGLASRSDNMFFQFGENNFLNKCKNSGVNGLILVDLPWPYNKIFAKKCKKNFITFVQLLSPTTSNSVSYTHLRAHET